MKSILKAIISFFTALFAKKEIPQSQETANKEEQLSLPVYLPLAWSKKLPQSVTDYTLKRIEELWPSLSKVKDMTYFRSDWHELTKREQINVFGEFIAWLAYYESDWNPKSSSTDVGKEGDLNTHSRGLLQVSQVDQANYEVWPVSADGKKYSYSAADILDPINNIDLGLMLLACLIEKDGLLRRKRGNWITWATLAPGNKNDKSAEIAKKTNAFPIKANRKPGKTPQEPVNTPRLPDKEETTPITPPWLTEAKKYEGKKETDPAFNKQMSAKWSLFGMNLGTISESWAAWCGLGIAVSLAAVGLKYQYDGSLAKNWDKYGQVIEWKVNGIPQGAIIRLNHKFDCSSESSNHVTMANGFCTAKDLLKSGASFDGYGGNQNNQWKVSTYPVKEICSVRWPSEVKLPPPVTKSVNCTSAKQSQESTR